MLVPAMQSMGTCICFEHLENADVRGPLGAAAGEHQAYSRPLREYRLIARLEADSGGCARLPEDRRSGQRRNQSDQYGAANMPRDFST